MINSILSIFREQARRHKIIQSFYYNRNYELGNGNETHPVFWLEDPLTGRNQNNTFINSLNFSILFIPENDAEVPTLQNLAFSAGLNILERIKQDKNMPVGILPAWTYTTLRDYYDNNACGCRFSVDLTHRNMQNLCLIEEQFENEKEFENEIPLNSFDLQGNVNPEVFTGKLPAFDLRTSCQ
ncbi:hypothetical protein [Viscerimonas tarda]